MEFYLDLIHAIEFVISPVPYITALKVFMKSFKGVCLWDSLFVSGLNQCRTWNCFACYGIFSEVGTAILAGSVPGLGSSKQVDCLALICVNYAFLRMVRKYELITHFPVVYADLRAVRKFAMILVWCPACTPVRLHHSPWAGVSLGFLVTKKHVIIVQVLVSHCQQIQL